LETGVPTLEIISSDIGTKLTVRWENILGLYCVADKGICNLSATGICNAIINYLSIRYFGFVADGRYFFFFQTLW
jgi:hypothetical protein